MTHDDWSSAATARREFFEQEAAMYGEGGVATASGLVAGTALARRHDKAAPRAPRRACRVCARGIRRAHTARAPLQIQIKSKVLLLRPARIIAWRSAVDQWIGAVGAARPNRWPSQVQYGHPALILRGRI